MASNSLRGGKNIYGSGSLMSNWFEERLEPRNQEAARMKAIALPTKSAKTWSVTSTAVGAASREAMLKASLSTETSNWLKYQKDGDDRYNTTSGTAFRHPDLQKQPFEAMSIPEDKLAEYREKWTKSESWQFDRMEGPGRGNFTPRTLRTSAALVLAK